ncbi:PREDICTED: leishmanolysin-like peptidase [Amphimedon queenslandica]|uniref:Leishmanolysin-like peptidase n=1 Tax=Amphimedon queenslandica TaxID=400682 RepID=A0AAN0JHA8_AMPQE|nr:PREDICTED: leishmanolysin-like peptidase [Amphimedon queenslandica]|eukprot:XP_019856349.1 PREDICTED: leishmanolysin-like peptidase [Amphimedon queenslandica]
MGTGLSNPRAETYGEGSRCVEHNTSWVAAGSSSSVPLSFPQAGCYQYECSNGAVTIFILGQSYHCSQAGEVLTVNQVNNSVTYTGTIICPSCLEICYDDFENCPEAAALYQVGASTASSSSTTVNATPDPSATNTVSSRSSQSTIVNATPSSTTAPSTSPTSSGYGLIPFLSLMLFGILTAILMNIAN